VELEQYTRTHPFLRVEEQGLEQLQMPIGKLLVLFALHETRRMFLSPFISKASRRVSSFFLSVQLSQPYVATGHTSASISRIFIEIGMM